ncbi:MAG: T9SS type A sorting domain-containing protein [Syntrophothermus sp.]
MNKMINNFLFILILTLITASNFCSAQSLQIKDGWYYVDGQKFFVKGIGYETNSRPGHLPWVYKFDADLIRHDLINIKEAGFNTIRTWAALSEEELKLVDESGLKIIFGLYVDNAGDFKSQTFRISALNQVSSVLNYSKKYKCIIGYLIMNEPMVEQIYNTGAQYFYDYWKDVVDLIHKEHMGIPVSFSSALVGDYISMDLFDFAAYNAYIYSPVTLSHAPGYTEFLSYLKNSHAPQKPLIVSEYGLSVSPGTPGTIYTYGGNTLAQQANGDLKMYRSLIDAGAQGGAVFQYHDGWWKGGDEFVHNATAEEWFGLFEFANLDDRFGTPRPVWSAFSTYNKAIIAEPGNEKIYSGQIPVEIFTTGDVYSFSVVMNDSTLMNQNINNGYFKGNIALNIKEEVKDAQLTFLFYNASGAVVKSEAISVLCSKGQVLLPEIKMEIAPDILFPGGRNNFIIEITNNSLFTIEESKIDYAVHPHIGFDDGFKKSKNFTLVDNKYSFVDFFDIPKETKVATFGAGFTIRYGNFTKRIFTQQILTAGAWADPILTSVRGIDKNSLTAPAVFYLKQNYPNPFNPASTIRYSIPHQTVVSLIIYNLIGQEVATLVNKEQAAGEYKVRFDGSSLPSGMYIYTIQAGHLRDSKKLLLLK